MVEGGFRVCCISLALLVDVVLAAAGVVVEVVGVTQVSMALVAGGGNDVAVSEWGG